MEAQHSPHPWTASERWHQHGETGRDILGPDGLRILSVTHRSDQPTKGEANVSLLLAAPDLLAACQAAHDAMFFIGTTEEVDHKMMDTKRLLSAAIAKATGGAA